MGVTPPSVWAVPRITTKLCIKPAMQELEPRHARSGWNAGGTQGDTLVVGCYADVLSWHTPRLVCLAAQLLSPGKSSKVAAAGLVQHHVCCTLHFHYNSIHSIQIVSVHIVSILGSCTQIVSILLSVSCPARALYPAACSLFADTCNCYLSTV